MTIVGDLDYILGGGYPSQKVDKVLDFLQDGDVLSWLMEQGLSDTHILIYCDCLNLLRTKLIPSVPVEVPSVDSPPENPNG